MNQTWCDTHCHSRPIHFNQTTVVCLSHQEILTHQVYKHFSAGIHPWWISNLNIADLDILKNHLNTLATSSGVCAIGETGLDRLYKETWDQQVELFHWHWDLAETHSLPLVIHKVRSGSDFLGLLKAKKPKTPWIFHDYHGTPEEVESLIKLHSDCYFSFGVSLLKRETLHETVESIPLARLLIETDEESQLELPRFYEKMTQIRRLSAQELQHQISTNFHLLFKNS